MRLSEDTQSWLVSYEELQSLSSLLAVPANPLGIITGQMTPLDAGVKETWNTFQAAEQELLKAMLTTLASPQLTIHLAWTVGDFYCHHVTLSRPVGQKEVVWLAQQPQGDQYQLQTLATDEINMLLNDILQSAGLDDDNSNQTLSAAAVMGLLGTTELMRQGYHQSMLNHQPANNSFTAEQVQTVLATAKQEDFRWPSCFWEKSLPIDISVMVEKIPGAIQELSTAGWLQSSSPGQFWFTDSALFLAEEILNEQAKVSITVATTDGQEILLQDSILLVRGPRALWLYYLMGDQGGIGQVGASGLTELSKTLLSPPEVLAAASQVTRFCPHCGKGIVPQTRFCGSCGAAL